MTLPLTSSLRLGLLTLVAASLSLTACATKPERRGPPTDKKGGDRPARTSGTFLQPIAIVFAGMDKDGNKLISRAELKDGTIAEWSTFNQRPSAAYFAQWSLKNLGSTDAMPTFMSFDRDFNGVITANEFSEQFESAFQRMDKNNDGQLERSEMLIAFNAPQGQRSGRGGEKSGGKGGRGGKGGGRPPR